MGGVGGGLLYSTTSLKGNVGNLRSTSNNEFLIQFSHAYSGPQDKHANEVYYAQGELCFSRLVLYVYLFSLIIFASDVFTMYEWKYMYNNLVATFIDHISTILAWRYCGNDMHM